MNYALGFFSAFFLCTINATKGGGRKTRKIEEIDKIIQVKLIAPKEFEALIMSIKRIDEVQSALNSAAEGEERDGLRREMEQLNQTVFELERTLNDVLEEKGYLKRGNKLVLRKDVCKNLPFLDPNPTIT